MGKAEETRRSILSQALILASESNLEALTIGSLAKASGLSKSGLFAHFKSKENLQVAVLEYASDIFIDTVINPCRSIADPVERLHQLVEHWLDWYCDTAKGCIFIVAIIEFDDNPGAVQDALKYQQQRWINFLQRTVGEAVSEGLFIVNTDVEQFVFELYSIYLASEMFTWLKFEDQKRSRFYKSFKSLVERHLK